MKKYFVVLVVLVAMVVGGFVAHWAYKYYALPFIPEFPDNGYYESLEERAAAAKVVARRRGLSQNYCVFVDYSIPSGTPRMFVWSYEENRVVASTYVMHGSGGGSTDSKPVFSNRPGSKCSTLGRFEITKQHGNRNKTGYYLNGLDFGNKNARARALMIHRAKWVDMNCWRKYIPVNGNCCQGCLTVSTKGLNYIDKLVKSDKKNILVWSYCSEE